MNKSNIFKGLAVIFIVGIVFAWFWRQGAEQDFVPDQRASKQQDQILEGPTETSSSEEGLVTEEQETPVQKAEEAEASTRPTYAQGKVVGKVSAEEVGSTPEAGGIGVSGAIFDAEGRAVVVDRFKNTIYGIDENGVRDVLLELDEDDFLKGAAVGPNGEVIALVGHAELEMVRVGPDGSMTREKLEFRPDHLNSMRVEMTEEGTLIYGQEKTYEVAADGSVNEFYGTPTGVDGQVLDVVLDEGIASVTLRNREGAPLETHQIDGQFGQVQGVYSAGSGSNVIVYESDPFLNDYNAQNPHYIVHRVNERGEVQGEIHIPYNADLMIDQPIDVKGDRLIFSRQGDEEGLEVTEYNLP